MRFDDRLLTVLNQPVGDRHDAAVRWRQLVDLVARAGPSSASPVLDRALETIRSEAPRIDEDLRAAAARAVAARPLPFGLLQYFIADGLTVSAPVLAAASLDAAEWRELLQASDEETRRFVEALHPEVPAASAEPHVLAEAPETAESLQSQLDALAAAVNGEKAPAPAAPAPSLSEVVARIERRRRARPAERVVEASRAVAVPADAPSLFRWECGPSGDIAWVDGAPRGALIGRSIARAQDDDRIDEDVTRAFSMRAPFRDAGMLLAGDGLVAGEWKISGLPAFDPTDGRFAGYRGIALRHAAPPEPREISPDILADPDSLRELVHEIKTPLNAIIGFAEIIEGQYLGPADHRYRQRAGEIVGEARLLLSAIDDLDFAAKIHSASQSSDRAAADLRAIVQAAGETLAAEAAARSVEFELAPNGDIPLAAVEPEIAERLVKRFGSAVIERAEAGEQLRLSLDEGSGQCRVSISRPAALRNLPDAQLFDAVGDGPEQGGRLAGFSLRLARGLARIAGGDLLPSRAGLTLVFPAA